MVIYISKFVVKNGLLAKLLMWLESVAVFNYGDLDLYWIQYMPWYGNQNH